MLFRDNIFVNIAWLCLEYFLIFIIFPLRRWSLIILNEIMSNFALRKKDIANYLMQIRADNEPR